MKTRETLVAVLPNTTGNDNSVVVAIGKCRVVRAWAINTSGAAAFARLYDSHTPVPLLARPRADVCWQAAANAMQSQEVDSDFRYGVCVASTTDPITGATASSANVMVYVVVERE